MKSVRVLIIAIAVSLVSLSAQAASVFCLDIPFSIEFANVNESKASGTFFEQIKQFEPIDDSAGVSRLVVERERLVLSFNEAGEKEDEKVSVLPSSHHSQADGFIVNGGLYHEICSHLIMSNLANPDITLASISQFFGNAFGGTRDITDMNDSTWSSGGEMPGDAQDESSASSNEETLGTDVAVDSDFAAVDMAHSMLLKPAPMLLLSFVGLAIISWRRWRSVISPVRRR